MKVKKNLMWLLRRFKYVIVIILGVALITVIGENSMLQRYRYAKQISDLEEEIDKQNAQYQHDSLRLVQMERDPDVVRKIARERYFMKANNEDIFVLSDEIGEDGYAATK